MSAWKPIESAPRDGTRVLLWTGFNVLIGWWDNEAELGRFQRGPAWQIFASEDDTFYAWAEDSPTHWMPFPSPPEQEEKP